METLRIATRQSALALWQANHVKALIEQAHPDTTCEIVGMTTEGDRNKVSPLSQMGGKGVFVKELEAGLLEGAVDIAVHSMKDVPGELPTGLEIGAIVERASPRDALISNSCGHLDELPAGAIVGSSSLRRVLQIQQAYPALQFKELRGNVDTRLRKLDEQHYDAIILAVAGLRRLGLDDRIAQEISEEISLPAAGQGAVGIEYRSDNLAVSHLLESINHQATHDCVRAERRVTQILGATCNLPVAVFAQLRGVEIFIRAFVANTSGSEMLRESARGGVSQAMQLATDVGERLLERGASRLMLQADA